MKIVFRADASRKLGSGHVMRCLTLADAARLRGAECRFVSRGMPDSLGKLLRARGHELIALGGQGGDSGTQAHDAQGTAEEVAGESADWLVVDHYALGQPWERALRRNSRRILAIDDLADRDHDCDLLLDQNFYANLESRYAQRVPRHCRTLLGPRFALLRAEFREARSRARARNGDCRRLLIFFGGMDEADCTSAALDAIVSLHWTPLAVDVVIGADHSSRAAIAATCAAYGLTLHVQTERIAELMFDADLALGAGGSTSWERCCVGLPALLVAVADNQRGLVRDSELAGFAYAPAADRLDAAFFARHLEILRNAPARLQAMSHRGLELVDGRGVFRVLRAMGFTPVHTRAATLDDSRAIFEWRNHPDIRRVSRNDTPIAWASHEAWFSAVLANPDRPLLIGEIDGLAAGVVRFDIEGDSADISIYKVPGHPNRAAGADVLASAEQWLCAHRPQVRRLTATVLAGNDASHRLFLSAGYSADVSRYSKRISE